MYNIHLVVPRISNDENTVAIIKADAEKHLTSDDAFFFALTESLTNWTHTVSGRQVFEHIGSDFNIGDLVHYLGDTELTRCLTEQGICNLSLTIEQT